MIAPERAVVVTIKIGADTRKDMIDSLFVIANEMEREGIPICSTSGGYSSGWQIDSKVDESVTHEIYFQRVNEYLKELHTEEPTHAT